MLSLAECNGRRIRNWPPRARRNINAERTQTRRRFLYTTDTTHAQDYNIVIKYDLQYIIILGIYLYIIIYKRTSSSVRVQYLIARPAHVFGGVVSGDINFRRAYNPTTSRTQTTTSKIYAFYYNKKKRIACFLVSGNLGTY